MRNRSHSFSTIRQCLCLVLLVAGCKGGDIVSAWSAADLDLHQDDFANPEFKPTPEVLAPDAKSSELGLPFYPGSTVAMEPEKTIIKNGIKCELNVRIRGQRGSLDYKHDRHCKTITCYAPPRT